MAAPTRRIIIFATLFATTIWIWGLSAFVFASRWNSVDRPGPPVYEAFPYGEIRIGVDASYPPFAVATGNELYGIDIDLGRALSQKLEMPARFINMGFDGLYDSIIADQVDMVISALIMDPSRTQEVRYTRPYFNSGLTLVSLPDSDIQSMRDIAGKKLAFEFGGRADEEARKWARRIDPFESRPFELAAHALDDTLIHRRSDAALVDAISFALYMRDHATARAQSHYITDEFLVIAIRKDRRQTWEAVDQALQSLIEAGALHQILERWL